MTTISQEKAIQMADTLAKRAGEAVVTKAEFLPDSDRFGQPAVYIVAVWTSEFGSTKAEIGSTRETPFTRSTLVYRTAR